MLNAPSGKIVISTINGTITVNSAQINVADITVAQISPNAITVWNAFNVDARRDSKVVLRISELKIVPKEIAPEANPGIKSTQLSTLT